jgi:PPM family protein phosphatase
MQFACFSHRGNVREINEDSVHIPAQGQKAEPPYFMAVADGMGGHNAGEVASAMAIRSMVNLIKEEGIREALDENPVKALRRATIETNDKVYLLGRQSVKFRGMGTTLTAALCTQRSVIVSQLGDSRAYLVHPDGRYMRITRDHTLVQEYIDHNLMTPEQAVVDPRRNILVKALGTELGQAPDMYEIPWQQGDRLILCSDGVTAYFDDAELCAHVCFSPSIETCAAEVGELSLQRGGSDNISLCLALNQGGMPL